MEAEILSNINTIKVRIEAACEKSNRPAKSVKLLLATKTVPSDRIKFVLQMGYRLIAENRIQELKEKFEDLKEIDHVNHFIGHLQTNKIKDILKYNVSCIQSLDRIDLATKLNDRLELEKRTIDVLIQVNTSGEESKFGIHPDLAIDFIKQVAQFKNLRIKGLMTIALLSAESEKVRECFRLLKSLQEQIIAADIQNVEMKELSMGMSGDFEIAIEEGATIVRVGTAIFGERLTSDSYYWNEN